MEIKLTKEQYEDLVKLVYLGNWMINAIRVHDLVEKFEELEQYIFSFYNEFGLKDYIEYDEEDKRFYPTRKFEMESEAQEYRAEYDNDTFWDNLINRLASRDFVKKYEEHAIKKMTIEEIIEKHNSFAKKYEEEFEKYGIDRLEIKE